MGKWQPTVGAMAEKLSWMDKSVLVTGGSGFVGQAMVSRFINQGARVTNLDIAWPNPVIHGTNFTLDLWDLTNYDLIERAIVESRPDAIFHLGAITQVVNAKTMPGQTYATNVMGTVNVLEAARKVGKRDIPVVVASSDKAYGFMPPGIVATETTDLQPTHPYDTSKACADLISRSYGLFFGLNTATVRCGNIYGPGDRNWQRIVPGALRAGLLGTELVVRSDGTLAREYNFIGDIIDAYIDIAEGLISNRVVKGKVWLVSDPTNRLSVERVILACEDACGYPIRRVYTNQATDEGKSIDLDPRSIFELGWTPMTTFEAGLAQTAAWLAGELGMGIL